MAQNTIPLRKDVPARDQWDLSVLYPSTEAWEAALAEIPALAQKVAAYKGTLAASKDNLLAALHALEALYRRIEQVGQYASLAYTADESDADAQDRNDRATMASARADAETSFFSPELLSIDDATVRGWISAPEFADYRVFLEKELRMKAHILSEKEENLLALQTESAQTAHKTFSLLTNVDLQFEPVSVRGEEQPLTQSTWSLLMEDHDRAVRKDAYTKFYSAFERHQNTIAALYAGSVHQDIFRARARGYASSLEAALFGDKVPISVYKNLIDAVHAGFPALHRYYSLCKRLLALDVLRHYDVYAPIVKDVETRTTYEEGVEICRAALAPLGAEYTDTLCDGLLHGWVDRYENKGKRSGAFSSGGYIGYPYILLNYKESNLRDVFTIAHEGGHSMHSYYSARSNPFLCYGYTIFEAEVASTFNEELLSRHLLKKAADDGDEKLRVYLLAARAKDIVATLFRQTMFAEFELQAHELVEGGTPLTTALLRKTYRNLLEQYFGPEMAFEETSDLEGLRIPHFYNAFYVYKYATGISAALALANRVCGGGKREREDYFAFLKSGGSRYPIESLRIAGVDMESSAPVQSAVATFDALVHELENTLKERFAPSDDRK